MVLRRKPDALTNVMSQLKENPTYQGQDQLPVMVWVISQVSFLLKENNSIILTKMRSFVCFSDNIFLKVLCFPL